ncbi:MAG: hypothetical protein JO053_11310, partial [Acidobacteria bacterium]|nr:hypothetical protein [Acidobacteriota bacterium]
NLDRAIQEYKASLAINPDHELTLQDLAAAYKAAGNKEELAKTVAHLKQVNPKNEAIAKYEGQ